MQIKTKILHSIVNNKYNFCALCFDNIESGININDQVIYDIDHPNDSLEISEILFYIFGDIPSNIAALNNLICSDCKENSINSFKFLQKCRKNQEYLEQTLATIGDCIENTTEKDMDKMATLFVLIEDCTTKQFYDTNSYDCNETAYARLKYLTKLSKQKLRKAKDCDDKDGSFTVLTENCIKKFKCMQCLLVFNKKWNLKKHFLTKHCEKTFTCTECHKSYGSESLLNQHKYDCHSDVICVTCGKRYKNRYSLLYHMRCHTGEKPYPCPHCDVQFAWSSRRAEHIRRLHTKEKTVSCNLCSSKFKSLNVLYDHRRKHSNPNSRLFINAQTGISKINSIDGKFIKIDGNVVSKINRVTDEEIIDEENMKFLSLI